MSSIVYVRPAAVILRDCQMINDDLSRLIADSWELLAKDRDPVVISAKEKARQKAEWAAWDDQYQRNRQCALAKFLGTIVSAEDVGGVEQITFSDGRKLRLLEPCYEWID